jgi:hypothetical protein
VISHCFEDAKRRSTGLQEQCINPVSQGTEVEHVATVGYVAQPARPQRKVIARRQQARIGRFVAAGLLRRIH